MAELCLLSCPGRDCVWFPRQTSCWEDAKQTFGTERDVQARRFLANHSKLTLLKFTSYQKTTGSLMRFPVTLLHCCVLDKWVLAPGGELPQLCFIGNLYSSSCFVFGYNYLQKKGLWWKVNENNLN